MPKKKTTVPDKIPKLVKWNKRPFLDKMLDDGITANMCCKWCRENGFEISVPTMYKYAKMRKEKALEDLAMEKEFGIKKPEKLGSNVKKPIPNAQEQRRTERLGVDREKRVMTDLQMLDEVIQKGYEALHELPDMMITPTVAMKAIELKNKITEGKHMGLTTYGLEEIKLREQARENAMLVVLLEFVPEEKHEALVARMEEETKRFYDNVGLSEAYEALGAEAVNAE